MDFFARLHSFVKRVAGRVASCTLVREVGRVKGGFVYEVAQGGVFGGCLRVSASSFR